MPRKRSSWSALMECNCGDPERSKLGQVLVLDQPIPGPRPEEHVARPGRDHQLLGRALVLLDGDDFMAHPAEGLGHFRFGAPGKANIRTVGDLHPMNPNSAGSVTTTKPAELISIF